MNRVIIKVCGVTGERDAVEAAHLGVDAVGFHFREDSPRRVDPAAVRRIVERLPIFVHKIGVFADDPPIRVLEVVREAGLTAVQFEGGENPAACAAVAPVPWYKTVVPGPGFEPDRLGDFPCSTFLLRRPPSEGETGAAPWAWRHARPLSLYGRILIGGGLDPASVGMAIEDARPYGVDVCDEVEIVPGQKDMDRLELFVEAVRRAERRVRDEAGAAP